MAAIETKKITVTLPKRLLKELDEMVPPGERSLFIAQAVREQLAILEQAQVVDEAAGLWQDDAYPEFSTGEKIDEWLTQLRQGWQRDELV